MIKPDLAVRLGGIAMPNPVTTASGTFGFGTEYEDYVKINRLGAITVKSITLKPRAGNPPPRIVETVGGMLNAVGLQNPGVDYFITEILPRLRAFQIPVIVSIAGETAEEYATLAHRLDQIAGVDGLEVNISCPNVKKGGLQFSSDPSSAAFVVSAVKKETSLPIIVKLSPNVTDITVIARSVAEAGADALALVNTLLGMAIDVRKKAPVLNNVIGGLSGPAIKPIAVRMVWQVSQAVDLPIIGMGGIISTLDALEFIMAGATAIAVGTGNFYNPGTTLEIIDGLEKFCAENNVDDIKQLQGIAWKNNAS